MKAGRADSQNRKIERHKKIQEELTERLRFEQLMFELSARFVGVAPERIEIEIQEALKLILEFFEMDRCALVKIMRDGSHWRINHFAFKDDLPDFPVHVDLPVDLFPWIFRNILDQHDVIVFSTLKEMPPEAGVDKQSYEGLGIRSILNVPITVDGEMEYVLSIASHYRECAFPKDYIPRLRILGETIVRSLQLARTRQSLEEQEQFERLISDISSGFVIDSLEDIRSVINGWLRRIADFFQVDACGLRMFSEDGTRLDKTVEYVGEGVDPLPPNLLSYDLPWYVDRLIRRRPVVINRLDDLPEAAEKERLYCLTRNLKSILSVPIASGERTIGVCSLASMRSEIEWPQELIQRMRFIAEVFAAALIRDRMETQLRERLNRIKRSQTRLVHENLHLRKKIEGRHSRQDIVGQSRAMLDILSRIERVAETDATVLIEGETGTGKELLARAVHRLSRRGKKSLVTVNCAALPPTLIESELFGHTKGAFTGALTRMAGRFELADRATLFLDEIGELPLDIQAKLLRVLEDGAFERLGSSEPMRVDVRLIAATNRDLKQMSVEGRFRDDLFYRLNVFPITIPPLRERPEDIPLLVWTFIRQFEKKMGKRVERIGEKGMDEMIQYSWPGNARELRNIVEHAMILSSGKVIDLQPPKIASHPSEENLNLGDVERRHILRVLRKTGWRLSGKGGAAEILGLKRTTLQSKMNKLGIRRENQ